MQPGFIRENLGRLDISDRLGHAFVLLSFFLALVVFFSAPVLALAWSARPFPGFVVEQTLVVANIGDLSWAGRSQGINYPQRVVQVNGQSVDNPSEFNQAISKMSTGENVRIRTVLPNGQVTTYPSVLLMPFPARDLTNKFWLPYGVGLVFLAISFWVYRLRGNTRAGRAFAFYGLSTALTVALLFDLTSTHAGSALWTLAISNVGGAMISLSLLFPDEWPPVQKRPWLRFLPYGVSFALAAFGLLVLRSQINPWAYVEAWRLSYFYTALGILFFLAIMVYRLRTRLSATSQQQVRIILWGSLLAFAPVTVWAGAPLFGILIPFNTLLFLPFLLIFPLSIGIAILRYRLWDVEVFVNRTLVYSALTLIVTLLYLVLVIGLEQIFRITTGQSSPLIIAASTLVIAALFNPLRIRLQKLVDQSFYHIKFETARALAKFSETLRDEVDLVHLVNSLEKVIQENIQPEQVLTWLPSPDGFAISAFAARMEFNEWPQRTIPVDDPAIKVLLQSSGVIELDRVDGDEPALQMLQAAGVKAIVPLVSQGELTGFLALGARLNRQGFSMDDYRLLSMLASQAAPAIQIAQLARQQQAEALERERMERELQVARSIQLTLLPKELPALAGWQLANYYQAARAIGGDFYDFIHLPDGRLGLVIGDVSGKGIPAALVMATTRNLLRTVVQRGGSPGIVLKQVNNLLDPDIPQNMFVTCLYAVLDPASGRLVFANAGHNLPIRYSHDSVNELRATGMPLGLLPDMSYEEQEAILEPEDCLLFYSDGITEAHNPQKEMYGRSRLHASLGKFSGDGHALIDRLLHKLQDFTGPGWEQEDDVTMVLLKRESGR